MVVAIWGWICYLFSLSVLEPQFFMVSRIKVPPPPPQPFFFYLCRFDLSVKRHKITVCILYDEPSCFCLFGSIPISCWDGSTVWLPKTERRWTEKEQGSWLKGSLIIGQVAIHSCGKVPTGQLSFFVCLFVYYILLLTQNFDENVSL